MSTQPNPMLVMAYIALVHGAMHTCDVAKNGACRQKAIEMADRLGLPEAFRPQAHSDMADAMTKLALWLEQKADSAKLGF